MMAEESFIIKEMKEKLDTICNRLDSLENLSSRFIGGYGDKISFKESNSKRFDKLEEHLKNLDDKIKSFEVTQREYKKRSSRLEEQRNTDETEDIELQHVKNLNYLLLFSFFDLHKS